MLKGLFHSGATEPRPAWGRDQLLIMMVVMVWMLVLVLMCELVWIVWMWCWFLCSCRR